MAEKLSRKLSRGVQTSVYEVSGGVQECPEKVSIDCPEFIQASRNAVKYANLAVWHRVGEGLCLLALVSCCYLTVSKAPERLLVEVWLAFIGIVFIADPVSILTRSIAPQLRALVPIDIALIVTSMETWKKGNVWIVCVVFVLITIILFRRKNADWLSGYNWKMSAIVEKALEDNPEDKSTIYWNLQGRRQTISLLHECGYSFPQTAIDGYMKPIFCMGYWSGCKNNQKLSYLKSQITALESEIESLNGRLNERRHPDEELLERIGQLEQLTQFQRQTIQEQDEQISNLTLANVELSSNPVKEAPQTLDTINLNISPSVVPETKKQAPSPRVMTIESILRCKKSVRETAEETGVKKWQVEQIRKAQKMLSSGQTISEVISATNMKQEEVEFIQSFTVA